jgi:hypothetical protein
MGGESFVSYPLRRRPLCRLAASEILLEKIKKQAETKDQFTYCREFFYKGQTAVQYV